MTERAAAEGASQSHRIRDVLAEPEWADLLTDQDRRGLTPLFWQHILLYGEVKLDMTTRLDIRTDTPSSPP